MADQTKRPNPKSYRPDADDTAVVIELMEFYGVKTETQLISMAYRALRREMLALRDLYARPKTASQAATKQGRDGGGNK